jgi:hypothetical protein
VFAIWLPVLAGDSRSSWDSNVLDDPRVVSFWDGDRVAGRWFADRELGGLGGPGDIVWDAYYAFPKSAIWASTPTPLLAAGSDIVDNTSALEHEFIPLVS